MKLSQFKIRKMNNGRYQLDFINPFTKKKALSHSGRGPTL